MSRWLKYAFIALGILAALIIAAIIIVPRVFNPNDYKDQIASQVEHRTGRQLALPGDISLSVFPWVAVELGELSLANAAGFGPEPQLKLRHLQARVKLLPLLSKRIEMGKVSVDGLVLNLEKDQTGKTNWDDLVQNLGSAKTEPGAPESKPQASALGGLAVGGIEVTDATLEWRDQQKGETYSARGLGIETGPVTLGKPVDFNIQTGLEATKQRLQATVRLKGTANADLPAQHYTLDLGNFNAKLQGESIPAGATDFNLAAKLDADMKQHVVQVSALDLRGAGLAVTGDAKVSDFNAATPAADYKLTVRGDELAPLVKSAASQLDLGALPKSISKLRLDLGVSGSAERAQIAPMQVEVALAPAGAKPLTAELGSKQVEVDIKNKTLLTVGDGKLKVAGDNVVPLLQELGVKSPELAKLAVALHMDSAFAGSGKTLSVKPLNLRTTLTGERIPNNSAELNLSSQINADLASQSVEISELSLQGLGLDLRGNLKTSDLQQAPKFNGAIKLTPFDARKLLTALGQTVPTTADPKALTRVGMESGLSGTKSSLALNNLAVHLDETLLQGHIAVNNFSKPAVDLKLQIDGIDADRYLPPKAQTEEPSAPAKPAPATTGAADLPVAKLRELDVKGPISIGKLKIAKATMTNINVTLNAKDGLVKVAPVSAALYNGQFNGALTLDARTGPPQLVINESLAGVQVEPLLTDFSGKESKLAGTVVFKTDLKATGANVAGLKKTLNGNGNFAFRNGSVKGINLVRLVCDTATKVLGAGSFNAKDLTSAIGAAASKNTGERTEFSELQGTFGIDQGIFNNKDLDAKSPLLRVGGAGTVNLVTEQVQYTLPTELVGSCEGQGGRTAEELKGITIPIQVSGPYSAPKIGIDVEGLVKARGQKLLDKEKGKLEKKLQEKIPGASKLQDKLKGILNP